MGDIRKLIYGLGIGSFIIVIIMIAMADSQEKYNASYDEQNIENYNRLQELNEISEDIRINTNNTLSSNPLDVLGEFFKTGYSSIRLTSASIDIADDMTSEAINDANLGESGKELKVLIGTLLIFFVMGTIIAIAVGRDW